MIKLKITKFDKNKAYTEQLEEYERAQKVNIYNRDYVPRPEPNEVNSMLEVEISEAQWEAIRKEVLSSF